MNNQKSAFVASKSYMNADGFRSMRSALPTWPNLFPAYTISYSAATGKPLENGKKKLFVLCVLLLLLITSLIASLILAFLWFNAIQSEFNSNESVKISSNLASFHHQDSHLTSNHHHHHHHHHSTHSPPLKPTSTTVRSTTTTTTTTTTTPQSTIESEATNEDEGFGENENTSPSTNDQPNSEEHLINYYKNMKNELDRRPNKQRHEEEKLDGEFVEHHTVSDVPDDGPGELSLQPEQPITSSSNPNDQPSNLMRLNDYTHKTVDEQFYLPEQLVSLRAKQFCNLNSLVSAHRNASYECRSNHNPSVISSYFCNDKFVVLAKINALRETVITEQANPNERQLVSRYDVHIERILKRSPFLSVAFKKQGLTTNVTINLALLADELRQSNTLSCLGQPLELKVGQTYLLSGVIFGLSAVTGNCDLQLEWFNDLDENQRNQLISWSSRTTFSHC